ncbi:MAG: hypothetical protein Q7J78_07070 [Clostridiales bacterium]|nr:hypothetical protein [Clostridiales bacterium]
MKRKRSKFLTGMIALLPGAGHMFMGFMKTGLSLMSAFVFVIFLSTWLDIAPLLFILPLFWFYSFFDCINRRSASDEEFALLDDNFLFSIDKLVAVNGSIFQKRRLFAGILFLLLGGYLLWRNTLYSLYKFIPQELFDTIKNITRQAPQFILGIAIIIVGLRLVMRKKKECDSNV